jgi:hypothetical protein
MVRLRMMSNKWLETEGERKEGQEITKEINK